MSAISGRSVPQGGDGPQAVRRLRAGHAGRVGGPTPQGGRPHRGRRQHDLCAPHGRHVAVLGQGDVHRAGQGHSEPPHGHQR